MFGWWSGFFFSRPALKANARAADALLSAADALSVTVGGLEDPVHLQEAVDVSGLMTHHDALPGTSLTPVTADLYVQLREGAASSAATVESAVKTMLGWKSAKKVSPPLARGTEHGGQVETSPPSSIPAFWQALSQLEEGGGVIPLGLFNPLVRKRGDEIVSLPVPVELARRVQVISKEGDSVEQQIVISADGDEATLYFAVSCPALAVSPKFQIKVGEVDPSLPIFQEKSLVHSRSEGFNDSGCSDGEVFVVEDDATVLHFSSATGDLCSVNGKSASISYGAYTPLEDDPWVFRPRQRSGFPKRKFERMATRVITGAPLVNYAVQEFQEVGREVRLEASNDALFRHRIDLLLGYSGYSPTN